MDAKSQQKVIKAGFTILRMDDSPCIRIKYKDNDHKDWVTLENFETKAARQRRWDELMKQPLFIND